MGGVGDYLSSLGILSGKEFDTVFLGNSLRNYIFALIIFLFVILAFKLSKLILVHWVRHIVKRTKVTWDDAILDFISKIGWPAYVTLAMFAAATYLVLPSYVDKAMRYVLLFVLVLYAIKISFSFIDYYAREQMKKQEALGVQEKYVIRVLRTLAKGTVVVISILFMLANFGFNITSLIAGLGVGGIAIAFALQNILADLFSSFSIYFDKPFKEGDFIVIGTDQGFVKKIGIKSTRLQTLQGQELVIANSELTTARINNFKQMEKRKVVFSVGVEYRTPKTKLQKIPGEIKKIIDGIAGTEFDRAHLKSFGESSIDYEIAYFVGTGDYKDYMDKQQEINFRIIDLFSKEKIGFAFPTRTIYIEK